MSEKNKIYRSRQKSEADRELEKKWRDYLIEAVQKSPDKIENTAKAIAGLISITLTLLVSLTDKEQLKFSAAYHWTIGLWIGAILFSFCVHFPMPYRTHSKSTTSIIRTHKRLTTFKYILLVISMTLYLAGMVCLAREVM